MVERKGIFGLFRFSGILDQPYEVHPKFRNKIPDMSVPFAPSPKISGISGRMESTQDFSLGEDVRNGPVNLVVTDECAR